MAETEGIYRASDGREVGRDVMEAVGADDVAESAPQEALGWGAGLDVGRRGRYAPVARPGLGLLNCPRKKVPDLTLSRSVQYVQSSPRHEKIFFWQAPDLVYLEPRGMGMTVLLESARSS